MVSTLHGRPHAIECVSASRSQDSPDVILIGYQDQGNLGMGYLASVLQRAGRTVELIEVRDGPERIAARLAARQPYIVGFSLIFQFFLPQFRRLAAHLRKAGVTSHFTIGGHYPSLCHDETLLQFSELDSVVRYEGEQTLLELTERLASERAWRETPGIAYLSGGTVVETEPRPLTLDLDSFPFPYRPYPPEQIGGFPTLPLLASRGCARQCSFCSIHTFYRTAPGRTVRVRKPATVVEEMMQLYNERGVRIFLFQDDDFPIWARPGRRWADELMGRLHDSGLADRTIWKISCRAEYVEDELFSNLREGGLFLTYMGIESGVEIGLAMLHKQMTVQDNLSAVATLKRLGIIFSYGFMLFDPSSTFESVRKNIAFLRRIVGDGAAAANFCRMLPYGGTPIRELLKKEGRLRGDLTHPDYVFTDLRLNEYHRMLSQAVRPWVNDNGLTYQIGYAWDEFEAIRRLVHGIEASDIYDRELRRLTADSNERLFQLVEQSSVAFENGDRRPIDARSVGEYCAAAISGLTAIRNSFIATNIHQIVESQAGCVPVAMARDCTKGPVLVPQVH